jgi:hypothetical protein
VTPITYDRWGHNVTSLSPLRERRLLQMAWDPRHDHKRHYGEYCFLMRHGFVQWHLGTAFLTEAGAMRLYDLMSEGI